MTETSTNVLFVCVEFVVCVVGGVAVVVVVVAVVVVVCSTRERNKLQPQITTQTHKQNKLEENNMIPMALYKCI